MRLTMYAYHNGENSTHVVARVRLSKGSQGIVDGFTLIAHCGAQAETSELDFESGDEQVTCPECYPEPLRKEL